MYQPIHLSEKVFYVGVNDRRTALFENMWPLDRGIAYNSYLVVDEKIALIDTVEIAHVDNFLSKIKATIGDKPIDYLIINHMEPDHAGSIKLLAGIYPNMKLVGNKKSQPMVEGFFDIKERFVEVAEGETLSLGATNLEFYMIPMVHWPETMVTYHSNDGIVFSGDAFGSFGSLDGGIFDHEIEFSYFEDEMRRYYSNIVGKYGNPVQKALEKLSALKINTIAATHGPILTKHIPEVLEKYQKWSKYEADEGVVIAFASMYGNTEAMADAIARELAVQGIKQIRMYDVSKTHASYIISDIFKYKGVILGSPTYCNELHPNMESLVMQLEHMGIKDHYLGLFGSFSWAGAAVKRLQAFAEKIKWEVVGEPVEEKYTLKEDKYQECIKMAQEMAQKIKG